MYDAYTINGKVFSSAPPLKVKKGDWVRLRIINPSSATIYTLRIAGHPLLVTHTDGPKDECWITQRSYSS